MLNGLAGKTAVLTGAGSGFGLECMRIAAHGGMRLVLVDVQADALAAAEAEARRLGAADVLARQVDVSQAVAMEQLAAEVQARGGHVAGWIAMVGLSLVDVSGARTVAREDIERERRDFGGFRRVPASSALWSDPSIWPGGVWGAIQSVFGQIDARCALSETDRTFRPDHRAA